MPRWHKKKIKHTDTPSQHCDKRAQLSALDTGEWIKAQPFVVWTLQGNGALYCYWWVLQLTSGPSPTITNTIRKQKLITKKRCFVFLLKSCSLKFFLSNASAINSIYETSSASLCHVIALSLLCVTTDASKWNRWKETRKWVPPRPQTDFPLV